VTPAKYAEDGTAHIALQDVVVQPGHELHVQAPHGQNVHVVARSLQLGAGSVVHVGANTTMRLGELRAQPAAAGAALQDPGTFVVTGSGGSAGWNGGNGGMGPNGGPGMSGGYGSNGGWGSPGGHGGSSPNYNVVIGHLSGTLRVAIRGGRGGDGGAGGNGGIGGDGGPAGPGRLAAGGGGGMGGNGGPGGTGGDGSVVTVVFDTMDSGAQVVLENFPAPGGMGGMGGAGARGGMGSPPGPGGAAGALGQPGTPGRIGMLILKQSGSGKIQQVQ
jgi:hypothetical protein